MHALDAAHRPTLTHHGRERLPAGRESPPMATPAM
jgi:hypothetical protein